MTDESSDRERQTDEAVDRSCATAATTTRRYHRQPILQPARHSHAREPRLDATPVVDDNHSVNQHHARIAN